jgi:hypothetical protein
VRNSVRRRGSMASDELIAHPPLRRNADHESHNARDSALDRLPLIARLNV